MTMTSIGWAIIHSLWQGGIIALVTAGLLGAAHRAKPNVRYAISLIALGSMLVLPIATAMRTGDALRDELDSATPLSRIPDVTVSASPTASASPSPVTVTGAPSRAVDTPARKVVISAIDSALPWLVVAWMMGLLIASGRLIGGFARTRRVTHRATSAASRALELRVEKICAMLGITRAIELLESTAIDVPLVIGAIRPVVVVPVSLISGLTPLQLDMLLAHELAHVRRHDYLVNLVQTIIETLLFYHPAARWISDRAREERENCCDDIAINACSVDASQYTSTLLLLEESRGGSFGLAAAATGGSLLRRAQRLMTGRTSLELGPRWIAGVITIGAALFAGNEALAGIRSAYIQETPVALDKDSTGKLGKTPDMSGAAPGKVTKAPAGGTITDRWRWAEKNGGPDPYWIGYLIADDPSSNSKYYASEIPVRMDGNLTMSGRMSLGGGDLSNIIFTGVPLAPIVGAHSPSSTAIFFLVENGALGTRIQRIHIGTFSLPGYFARRPLVWLDSAADGESIELVASLMSRARGDEVRRDLVAALGLHGDANAVVPRLIGILQSSEPEGMRREAAEWLGQKGDARAIRALSRAARTDRSEGVRREAIESFQHMPMPGATDSLISFATSLTSHDLQRTAVESIGLRNDDRALAFLTRFVRSNASSDIRRQAIESLADMKDGRGMSVVIDVARNDGAQDVRREAVESLAQVEPAARAFDLLREIIRTDPDESVQSEAIETIAEVHDPGSVSILADIANRNPVERLQVEAVESLGETVAPERALPIVRDIARKHPVARVRKKAMEVLINFHDEASAIDAIINAVRTDPDDDVRAAALEALGDGGDPIALRTLESFIRGKDALDVRQKALEVYADAAATNVAVAMLRSVMTKDPDERMRARAAEILNDR